MFVTLDVVRGAFDHNSAAPRLQDLAGLLGYVYCRGHGWADRTSIASAIDQIQALDEVDPVLGPALLRLLTVCKRERGGGWSVADVDRMQWYRRQVDTWDRACVPSRGITWPGGSAWIDLRITHMRAEGMTVGEISGLLGISRRAVRGRVRRLSVDLGWLVLSPCVALRLGE